MFYLLTFNSVRMIHDKRKEKEIKVDNGMKLNLPT